MSQLGEGRQSWRSLLIADAGLSERGKAPNPANRHPGDSSTTVEMDQAAPGARHPSLPGTQGKTRRELTGGSVSLQVASETMNLGPLSGGSRTRRRPPEWPKLPLSRRTGIEQDLVSKVPTAATEIAELGAQRAIQSWGLCCIFPSTQDSLRLTVGAKLAP